MATGLLQVLDERYASLQLPSEGMEIVVRVEEIEGDHLRFDAEIISQRPLEKLREILVPDEILAQLKS